MVARGDGVSADGAHDGRVRERGLRRDDRVGDVVIDTLLAKIKSAHVYSNGLTNQSEEGVKTHRVLLLLHIQHRPILERPLHNIRLLGRALDPLALLELAPELAEVLQLDEVPDGGEGRGDDGRLADRGGGWDWWHFSFFVGSI